MKELNESPYKAFFLTKSNYVFMLIYIAVLLILLISFHEFKGYILGRALGKVLGTAVLSYLLGYICWLVSRKNKQVGEWGFNVMVIFITGTILTTYYKAHEMNQAAAEIQQAENTLYETLRKEKFDVKSFNQAYEQFSKNLFSGIDKQLEYAEGLDREILLVERAYLAEIQQVMNHWNTNLNQFTAKDILDPTMLKADPVVYENRLNIIHNLLQSTLQYKEMMKNMENEFNWRLQPLGLTPDRQIQVVKQFMHSPDVSPEQIQVYADELISLLDQYRKILNMMHYNQDQWYIEGTGIVSDDEGFLMGYNHAIENLWKKQAHVDELTAELFTD